MKKLLITGFDPFGGENINPSWEAVKELPDHIGDWQITKMEIPTVFGAAADQVIAAGEGLQPNAILCIGQAGGRAAVTPEVVAINLQEARISDNIGNQPMNIPVVKGGPAAYFATVPVREMVQSIQAASIPAALSYSAGTFVCNDVLYRLLHHFDGTDTQVGFIHVPYLPQQAKENQPSLPQDKIVEALKLAISVL